MPLLNAVGFLLGLVAKLWFLGAVIVYETFLDMFTFVPLAYVATTLLLLFVVFVVWATAKGIYG